MDTYTDHAEAAAIVSASSERVFARLDEQALLGSHMGKPSMMMMGGSMSYDLDAAQGRAVGSVIAMRGHFMGLRLLAREVVTEREPPRRKVWETRGPQRLLVIAAYRMGFEIQPRDQEAYLRVFIDYRRPQGLLGRMPVALVGGIYARWCVARMVADARRHFASNQGAT